MLLTKLHPSSARPAPLGMRKAVRATLILVPLFGLHFILIPFRPDQGSTFERAYQTFSAILVSMQVKITSHFNHLSFKSIYSRIYDIFSLPGFLRSVSLLLRKPRRAPNNGRPLPVIYRPTFRQHRRRYEWEYTE